MIKGLIKAEIPITAKELKIHEPNTFPTAISAFPFLATFTLTTNSGKDVPKAIAPAAIISFPIFRIVDNAITDSIVYLAPT